MKYYKKEYIQEIVNAKDVWNSLYSTDDIFLFAIIFIDIGRYDVAAAVDLKNKRFIFDTFQEAERHMFKLLKRRGYLPLQDKLEILL
jgi:hypothetical protein